MSRLGVDKYAIKQAFFPIITDCHFYPIKDIINSYRRKLQKMQVQNQIREIRSLAPIEALEPMYSVQEKSWCKIYRAQCMIPFPMYSIRIVYIITFVGYRIYVRVDLYVVPMVYPQAFPIEGTGSASMPTLCWQTGQIPIASYSFNCIFCARCNLGLSCRNHVPGFAQQTQMQDN